MARLINLPIKKMWSSPKSQKFNQKKLKSHCSRNQDNKNPRLVSRYIVQKLKKIENGDFEQYGGNVIFPEQIWVQALVWFFCEYSFYFQKVHVTLFLYTFLSLATQI